MEPYLNALRACDVVAIQTGPAGEYDLAYLLKDASTGRMLEPQNWELLLSLEPAPSPPASDLLRVAAAADWQR